MEELFEACFGQSSRIPIHIMAIPRVLFISEAVTLAHFARPMVLAKALRETANHSVLVACDRRYRHFAEQAGFDRIDISSIPSEKFLDALAKGNPLYDEATLEAYVEEDLRIIDTVEPDLIVGDFRLSLSVSARLRNIPYAAIANAYWSPFAKRENFPIPDLPVTRILGPRPAQFVFDRIRPMIFKLHARPLNQVRKKHGLPRLGGLLEVYTDADHVLYADVPMLAPTVELPANHHYLGAIVWSPPAPLPSWWNEIDPAKPSIFLSMGSSGRADLLAEVARSLSDLDCNLLVATAGRAHLDALPANAWAADYLPGVMAASKSDLIVCNGGSPAIHQALSQGKPVLGIPSNMDQYLAMEQVCRRRAGRLIRSIAASGARVREEAKNILGDDSYHMAANLIRQEIVGTNPEKNFCDFVARIFQ